jgi:hypothetical protein
MTLKNSFIFFKVVIVWINQNSVISYLYFEVHRFIMSENEKTGLNNSTYNILSALGRDADFLYDTIDKYIRDAESANKSDLVELWKTIKNDRHKHIDLLKGALEKEIHQ